ncbi:cytochrome b/b6 domain-containing protein [Paraburkholderia graminis]|uniref:cytochrome b/b6 domain-containing protein n=1 Tax=Paraburkholderia graminis TaxID=60548 RepID=UPI0038B85B78
MNHTFRSRPANGAGASGTVRILVWDAPVRVFHWLMVACFAGAWLTAESERWRVVHVTLGYTMIGLVAFRIVWGLVGTRYARFSDFVRSPASVVRYLASVVKLRPEPHLGHNPAGGIAIIVMLLLTCAVGVTGWLAYRSGTGGWLKDLHEGAANTMLAFVTVHVVAVLGSSLLHHDNLTGAMITGYKSGSAADGIRRAQWAFAVLLFAAVLAWWWTQWHTASQPGAVDHATVPANHSTARGDENDDK